MKILNIKVKRKKYRITWISQEFLDFSRKLSTRIHWFPGLRGVKKNVEGRKGGTVK